MRLIGALLITVCIQGAEPDWAGSRACSSCHGDIYQTYLQTPMAASSGPAGGGLVRETFDRAEFTHGRSNFRYRVRRDGGRYAFELEGVSGGRRIQTRREMLYFIGSGLVARSYAFALDGFLYQAPVAYYTGPQRWDLPPGYDQYSTPYLTRRILPGCLSCHASGAQLIPRTQNRYRTPPFLEGGVSCERCHGPGKAHIQKMTAGDLEGGPAIVNPARLPPEQRDSVCAQCHLSGAERVAKAGREKDVFLAGARLSDYLTVFVRAGGTPGMRVTSHMEKLAQSACKRASGDRLWCGSCHDPHSLPTASERAAWFRPKCLACHEDSACREQEARRKANGDDCAACHMPRSTVMDADHVVFTDHSIPRRPGPRGQAPPPDAPLVRFDGAPAGPRDAGLAYASLAGRERIPAYAERAFNLLREAVDGGARDAQTLLHLAELYKNRGDEKSAIPLYEEAMRLDPEQVGASVALGAIYADRGQWKEAIRLFNDALFKNPALSGVRTALALALLQTGETEAARLAAEKALEFDPAYAPAHQLLEQLRRAR